jgi:hypothetical protein
MDSYDPQIKPDPQEWLALHELDRIQLVEDYHRRARIRLPNENLHAIFHVVVENQIAEVTDLPVEDTLKRLMFEGLDRHEAIHAVGNVLAGTMFDLLKGKLDSDPNQQYAEELRSLTAEEWKRSG